MGGTRADLGRRAVSFPRDVPTDPGLRSAEYRRNRALLRAQRRPCARCGRAIAYDEPYWLATPGGRRSVNPRAFVAGHVIDRAAGGGHHLANLRPECARCSFTSGAQLGNRRQRRAAAVRGPKGRVEQAVTADRW